MGVTGLPRGERERMPARRGLRRYELVLRTRDADDEQAREQAGSRRDVKARKRRVYVDLGLRPDGRVGEIFVKTKGYSPLAQVGLGAWAVAVSKAIQWGMPVVEAADSFRGVRVDEGFVECDVVRALSRDDEGKLSRCASAYDAVAQLLAAVVGEDGKLVEDEGAEGLAAADEA